MDAIWIDHGQSSSTVGKTCLSPISLIELYVAEPANKTKQNPIYRSTRAMNKRSVVDDDVHEHANEHPNDDGDDYTSTYFNVANIQITPDTFLNLCPALLVQIEQGSCNERHNEVAEADPIIHPEEGTKRVGK